MVRIESPPQAEPREKPDVTAPRGVCVAEAVEAVVRCKWSLRVLGQIRRGVQRPGALLRACPGLSAKVLNERLRKMTRLGILERVAFAEIPPRVEYRLTELGRGFVKILDAIEQLQARVDAGSSTARPSAGRTSRSPGGARADRSARAAS